jgi:hypothetical protein
MTTVDGVLHLEQRTRRGRPPASVRQRGFKCSDSMSHLALNTLIAFASESEHRDCRSSTAACLMEGVPQASGRSRAGSSKTPRGGSGWVSRRPSTRKTGRRSEGSSGTGPARTASVRKRGTPARPHECQAMRRFAPVCPHPMKSTASGGGGTARFSGIRIRSLLLPRAGVVQKPD